jgi:hypothetical protein
VDIYVENSHIGQSLESCEYEVYQSSRHIATPREGQHNLLQCNDIHRGQSSCENSSESMIDLTHDFQRLPSQGSKIHSGEKPYWKAQSTTLLILVYNNKN